MDSKDISSGSSSSSMNYIGSENTGGMPAKYKSTRCAFCYTYRSMAPNRKFFCFPANEELCKKWVSACNRPYLLTKSIKQLHNSFKICSEHFKDCDYSSSSKNRLKSSALPFFQDCTKSYPSEDNLLSTLKLTLSDKLKSQEDKDSLSEDTNCTNSSIQNFAPCHSSTPKRKHEDLYSGISNKRQKINTSESPNTCGKGQIKVFTPKTKKNKILSTKLYFLKKKFEKQRTDINLNQTLLQVKALVSPIIYNFIAAQMKSDTAKSAYARRWTSEDKNYFLKIYLASPKAYNVLRKFLHFPTARTLKKSIAGIEVQTGFFLPVLSALSVISSKLKAQDKLCNVVFDEMKVKPGLNYYAKKDQIIGFEHYGGICESACTMATHALVFTVRGICKKWKQVFGAFFSTEPTSSCKLKILVNGAIEKIMDCGLEPKAIICDMGSNNQKLFTSELKITIEQPYFFVKEKKIYAIYDPPHLLKCLRNNFSKYKVKFDGGKVADWKHIVALYEFDCERPHRVVRKLTKTHIYLNGFNKMCVKRAAQVLSNSVASALCYLSALNGMPPSATNTADFCATANNLFDSVNNRTLKHPNVPLLSAVTKTSQHLTKWHEYKLFVQSIQFDTNGKKLYFPSLTGWQISLSAFLELIPELLEKVKFVLMSRFNQDCLENFFAQVRSRGGHNDHPTPADFLFRTRLLLAEEVLNLCSNTNCETDDDSPLIPLSLFKVSFKKMEGATDSSDEEEQLKNTLIIDESYMSPCSILENTDVEGDEFSRNSAAFVAGYLAKCLLFNKKARSSSCEKCKILLTTDKELTCSTIFINFKEYEHVKTGLVYPTEKLITTVTEFGIIFSFLFEQVAAKENISSIIMSHLKEVDHQWFNCSLHEKTSWKQLVQLYTQIMLFNKVKQLTKKLTGSLRKTKQKINKLS